MSQNRCDFKEKKIRLLEARGFVNHFNINFGARRDVSGISDESELEILVFTSFAISKPISKVINIPI
jgi:hypothetical protein